MDWKRFGREQSKYPQRRPDFWVRSIGCLSGIGWLLMVIALYEVSLAKPQVRSFFGFYHNKGVRQYWDMELMQLVLGLLACALVLAITGLFINSRRHRRPDDFYRLSLILLLISAASCIAWYFYSF